MITPKFSYDELEHKTICTINDTSYNIEVIGIAKCHPEDEKYESRITGETIAAYRAAIKYYKTILRERLMPEIKAYSHLRDIMVKNPQKYDLDSNEFKLVQRQYFYAIGEADELRDFIKEQQTELKIYLSDKAKLQKYLNLKGQK